MKKRYITLVIIITLVLVKWTVESFCLKNNLFLYIRNSTNSEVDDVKIFIDTLLILDKKITNENQWHFGNAYPNKLSLGKHTLIIKSKSLQKEIYYDFFVYYSHVIYIDFVVINDKKTYNINKQLGRKISP